MRLGEALRQSQPPHDADAKADDAAPVLVSAAPVAADPAGAPLASVKRRAQESLFNRLGSRLFDVSLSEQQIRSFVVQELGSIIEQEQVPLTSEERQRVVSAITDDVLGYGPIEAYLADAAVTEIMVNAENPIYVERAGRLYRTESRFLSEDHLRRVVDRIVAQIGRRIDESSPMVDARLPDGSRVNAIIPPLAIDGPALTIRKFSHHVLTLENLTELGTLTTDLADFLSACVRGRCNILVTGGTGTGKTTLLNVLSAMIPADERIVTIEDAAELRLKQEHVVRLESRPPNIEERGEVTIRYLVRNALRMRPDRIIVGEVRSGEALDMLQAMNTGHDGSLSTLHANAPRDALSRLETMVLMAGLELPVRAIREQAASALDLIIHLTRLRDGTRRITQVTEVEGMEGDVITLTDLFAFDYSAGIDDDGRFRGRVVPTGIRPRVTDRLGELGIELPASMFDVDPLEHAMPRQGGRRR